MTFRESVIIKITAGETTFNYMAYINVNMKPESGLQLSQNSWRRYLTYLTSSCSKLIGWGRGVMTNDGQLSPAAKDSVTVKQLRELHLNEGVQEYTLTKI